MGLLKKLLPIAASAGANFLMPGSGAAVGALVGGITQGKAKQKASQQAYQDALLAARPNQTNEYGDTSTWTKGSDGRDMQTVTLSPERKAILDSVTRGSGTSHATAEKWLSSHNPAMDVDWNAQGLGQYGEMMGFIPKGSGTTGKSPWSDDKYSSMGGDALKYLQYDDFNPGTGERSQTWGAGPMPVQGGTPAPVSTMPGTGGADEELKKIAAQNVAKSAAAGGGLLSSVVGR